MDDLRGLSRQGVLLGVCALALGACGSSPAGERGGTAGTGGQPEAGTSGSGAGGSGGSAGTGGTGQSGRGGEAGGGTGGATDSPDAAVADVGTAGGAGGSGEDASAPDGTMPAPPPGAVVPSPACAGGAMVPGPDGYQTVMANGKMRKFLVRVPSGYDGKTPRILFLGMHGAGNGVNGASFEGRISAIRKAMGANIIYAYPDGLPEPGGNVTWSRDYLDDLMFMDAMLAWMKEKVCFDTARVVAFGQSSGAYITHAMACHRGSVLRAVASNGGGGRINEFLNCLGQPVAAWVSNGAGDPSHLVDANRARDGWLKTNGCSADNPAKVDPPPCISYAGCKPGFPLHYCLNSGGHDIPGYAAAGVSAFFLGNFDK